MIVFDNLWKTMKNQGVSTYKLRENCLFGSRTVKLLRMNGNIETKTLNKICSFLDCSIEDIMSYRKDESAVGEAISHR